MGGAHGTGLLLDRHGPLHHVAAHCKLVATIAFIGAVVATPREQWWAFVLDAAILGGVAAYADISVGQLARRCRSSPSPC